MREGNGSQRQGVWLDNGGGVKNGYGAERNGWLFGFKQSYFRRSFVDCIEILCGRSDIQLVLNYLS